MKKDLREGIGLPETFDLEDVSDTSENVDIVYVGKVETWESEEISERTRARPYITSIVLFIWAITVIVSAIRFSITGDFLLAIPPAIILAPLCVVLKFYYKSGYSQMNVSSSHQEEEPFQEKDEYNKIKHKTASPVRFLTRRAKTFRNNARAIRRSYKSRSRP